MQSWQILDQIAFGYVFRKVDLTNDIWFFFFEQMNEFQDCVYKDRALYKFHMKASLNLKNNTLIMPNYFLENKQQHN